MAVDRLTPLDATFLELEEASESAHMHIGAVMTFDPLPDGGAPALDVFRGDLEPRLDALPRYRHRLSETHTGGISWPAWEPDAGFDIAAHVRRVALPAPGGYPELLEWASDFWSHRLDRGRPLWELVLIEGLGGGRWALASKVHHCMVDGVGSVDASHLMLDPSPTGRSGPVAQPPPEEGADEHGGGLLGLPAAAVRFGVGAARAGAGLAFHPGRARHALERSMATLDVLLKDELIAAPASTLNVPTGKRRRFEVVHARLDDVRAIKGALGGTVNDVVLATVTGGLHRLLEARGEEPPARGLRAMVPVNVRQAGEHLALGNRITSLFVHLPVAEEDPAARYASTVAEAESLKSGTQALGGETLLDLTGLAPPVVHSVLARSLFASRLFNVTVTNVPGPQMPLYAFGARMRDVLPLVPIAADHAVGIAVVSYDGGMTFGLNADYDAVPDIDVLRDGIQAELDELSALSGISPRGADAGPARAPSRPARPPGRAPSPP